MKNFAKVKDLYQRLAGDKLEKVNETCRKLMAGGKSEARAMADALEAHKCNKFKDEE